MTVRTFPFRIPPIPGEGLDSWLEIFASRHEVPFGDIVNRLGMPAQSRMRWLVRLSERQRNDIAHATGIDGATITSMTLSAYQGRAVEVDPETALLIPTFPFGYRRQSRFCPRCLAESGGRWQLQWRLGWAFACTRHRCLLIDECPRCGRVQRRESHHYAVVPRLGRCTAMKLGEEPCGADLTTAKVRQLPARHRVIKAQKTIFNVISDNYAKFGVYAHEPQSARAVLGDIKALTSRVLMHAAGHGLAVVEPSDLLPEFINHKPPPIVQSVYKGNGPCIPAPSPAPEAAVAMTAALTILQARTLGDAADRARWLSGPSIGKHNYGAAILSSCVHDSKIVATILIKAHAPSFGPLLQLRYRSALAIPAPPRRGQTSVHRVAQRLPSALWPDWSVRIALPGLAHQTQRVALSCSTLFVGNMISAKDAASLLGGAVDTFTVGKALASMRCCPQWEGLSAALTRLAEYLDTNLVPIDYNRRRQLDYTGLLPEHRWRQICWQIGILPGNGTRALIARCHQFERISGLPARDAPYEITSADPSGIWVRINNFPYDLTPRLARLLRQEGQRFLAERGIDEPLSWHPPLRLLAGLDLPGDDPRRIDVTELHRLITQERLPIGRIANQLHTNLDVLRYVLARYPATRKSEVEADSRAVLRPSDRIRGKLSPARLYHLYVSEGLTWSQIGRIYGVRTYLIKHVALLYEIPIRPAKPRPSGEWLVRQQVDMRRTIDDIAAEVGFSPTTVRQWIQKQKSISEDERPASTRSLSRQASLDILNGAFAGRPAWPHLRRYTAAMAHSTIAKAAKSMGVSEDFLRRQIHELEDDCGQPLLERARSGLPMRPTTLGARIADAVRAIEPTI